MLTKRIIPCLDVRDGTVVKGVNFVDLRQAGDPVALAARYNQMGADEICFLDITASVEARSALLDVISRTAQEVFIPLTVGGGVNSCDDVGALLKAGADKVGINSGAVKNPTLIRDAALQYGSQCIVVAVDVKLSQQSKSGWEVFVQGGRKATGLDALEWISKAVSLGAGEILLTSMDADGTKAGYDLPLTAAVCELVQVPVIASGGAGKLSDISEVFEKTGADAALLASMLHFGECTIAEIKEHMQQHNIATRISQLP